MHSIDSAIDLTLKCFPTVTVRSTSRADKSPDFAFRYVRPRYMCPCVCLSMKLTGRPVVSFASFSSFFLLLQLLPLFCCTASTRPLVTRVFGRFSPKRSLFGFPLALRTHSHISLNGLPDCVCMCGQMCGRAGDDDVKHWCVVPSRDPAIILPAESMAGASCCASRKLLLTHHLPETAVS